MDFFATCDAGLEEALASELWALGIKGKPASRGVAFSGAIEDLWRANLLSRIASRVLLFLARFPATDRDELFRGAARIRWANWIDRGRTIAVDAHIGASQMEHSGFVGLVVKDAVCDVLRDVRGERPDVDRRAADVPISVRLVKDRCTISLDSSGTRLHRRGYRRDAGVAPLKETMAAGILAIAGWDGQKTLIDPMCGSGTFAIEAALKARGRPPGWLRLESGGEGFAFERWPKHDAGRFGAFVRAIEGQVAPRTDLRIIASDISPASVQATRENAQRAGVQDEVEVLQRPLDQCEPSTPSGVLVMNPPYGARLGEGENLVALYRSIGDVLKQRFSNHEAWVLSGDFPLGRSIGLRPSKRIALWNGPIECRLLRFEMYAGTRKVKGEMKK